LAALFSRLSALNKKYTEPSEVLKALVDDFGQPLSLGDQKDIGEFNLNFLERVEEGLGERLEAKKLTNNLPTVEENKINQSTIFDSTEDSSTETSSNRSSRHSINLQ
jgi:hypothetical protein